MLLFIHLSSPPLFFHLSSVDNSSFFFVLFSFDLMRLNSEMKNSHEEIALALVYFMP